MGTQETQMIPVHELTVEQAVAELERIADSKPDSDQVIELARWTKQHDGRIALLEARILSAYGNSTGNEIAQRCLDSLID